LECPDGHELQPWTARAGVCDGCHKKVRTGEQVMDCRRCDWYLCRTCCPRVKEPSMWGAVSSFPFYAAEAAMRDLAWLASEVDTMTGGSSAATAAEPDVMTGTAVQTEAAELINEFCHSFSEERIEPSEQELQGLWLRCSVLYACTLQPGPLAAAICQQLAVRPEMSTSAGAWQPQLRAVCVLELFHEKGGLGKDVCEAVAGRVGAPLRRLAELPRCQDRTLKVLRDLGIDMPAVDVTEQQESALPRPSEEQQESRSKGPCPGPRPNEPADLIDLDHCICPGQDQEEVPQERAPVKSDEKSVATDKQVLLRKARLGAA